MKVITNTQTYIVKWFLAAIILGFLGSVVAGGIIISIDFLSEFRTEYPLFLAPLIAIPLLLILYKITPRASGYGTSVYLHNVNMDTDKASFKEAITKSLATIITLGAGGSGGLEGPALVIGSSLASPFKKLFDEENIRPLLITGAAALLGAVFHSPIGAGLFVAEITYRSSLHYKSAFPALLASIFGFLFSKYMFHHHAILEFTNTTLEIKTIPLVVVASFLGGVVALLYSFTFDKFINWSLVKFPLYLRVIISGILISIAMYVVPNATGIGVDVIHQISHMELGYTALITLIIAKILITSFTSGLGGSAGLILPALMIGSAAGAIVFQVLPLDSVFIAPLIVAGMAAALTGVSNAPIASTIFMLEMVGIELAVVAFIGSIMGYALANQHTIYDTLENAYLGKDDQATKH